MGLGRYLLRRIVLLVPTLLGLSILTFVISHIVPADPAKLAAGPRATSEMVESIRKDYGLDQPLIRQYFTYISDLFRGDFGTSIMTQRSVSSDLAARFPATAELVLYAMVLAIVVGVPLGILSAVYQNRWPDQVIRILAISSVSLPQFWIGILLQLTFASSLGWLPLSKRLPTLEVPPDKITGMYVTDSLLNGDVHLFLMSLKHLALPTIVLAMLPMAIIMRTLRGDMLNVMNQDFVRVARAKGLSEVKVILGHAARNAFIPSLTMIGLSFGWTLGGTVLVEVIFDWPGIGNYAVEAAGRLDFAPIMGVTMLIGVVFVVLNLVVDILYGVIDPRISY